MLNKGIAFGLFSGAPSWLGIVGLLFLLIIAVKTRQLLGRVGIALIFMGGLANTYMRFLYGGVVDNLKLWGLGYNNVADYLIFFGVLIYGYTYFVRRRGDSHN